MLVDETRAFLRKALAGCPRADDAIALGSEFSANAVLHSRSGAPGGTFTVRTEVSEDEWRDCVEPGVANTVFEHC